MASVKIKAALSEELTKPDNSSYWKINPWIKYNEETTKVKGKRDPKSEHVQASFTLRLPGKIVVILTLSIFPEYRRKDIISIASYPVEYSIEIHILKGLRHNKYLFSVSHIVEKWNHCRGDQKGHLNILILQEVKVWEDGNHICLYSLHLNSCNLKDTESSKIYIWKQNNQPQKVVCPRKNRVQKQILK